MNEAGTVHPNTRAALASKELVVGNSIAGNLNPVIWRWIFRPAQTRPQQKLFMKR